jgi:hypothetical protein
MSRHVAQLGQRTCFGSSPKNARCQAAFPQIGATVPHRIRWCRSRVGRSELCSPQVAQVTRKRQGPNILESSYSPATVAQYGGSVAWLPGPVSEPPRAVIRF